MDGLTASFEPDFTPPSPPKSGNPSAAPAEARQEKPEPKHEPEPPEIYEDNSHRHAADNHGAALISTVPPCVHQHGNKGNQ